MTPQQKRNIWGNFVGEGLWGLGAQIVAPAAVLTVLLTRLNASDVMIGSITALEGGGVVVMQFLGVMFFKSVKNRKRFLLLWHWFGAIPFLFIIAAIIFNAEHFSVRFLRFAVLGGFAILMILLGMIGALWAEWLSRLFTQDIRGRAVGMGTAAAYILGAAGAATAGWILERWPDLSTFAWLYIASGVISTISIFFFMLVNETIEVPASVTDMTITDLFRRYKISMGDRNFQMFLVGRLLAAFGFCIAPFIAVNFTSERGGSIPAGTVVSLFAFQPLAMGAASFLLGRMGDKRGHRMGIIVGAGMQVVTLVLLYFGTGKLACGMVYICAGICVGAAFISHYNLLLETCPHDSHLAHISLGNLITSFGTIGAPLLAGFAAEVWGLSVLFVGCIVFSIVAMLWLLLMVKEPRTLDAFLANGQSSM